MSTDWIGSTEHNRWLGTESRALLDWARRARVPAGFGWIGEDGRIDPSHPVELWITGRMTFAFSLGTLLGIPGCSIFADHGITALSTAMRDREHGGWYSAVSPQVDAEGHAASIDPAARKECYQHAFVVLAAAAATAAGRPGAELLLHDALAVQEEHWWDDEHGLPIESYKADFTGPEDYRGINAAMHTVEAYLAAADATGERLWLDRAVRIIDFAVNHQARSHGWRLPEHYDTSWVPRLDYNRDQPAHPFRPYGVTPGHGLEWARLTVQARGALLDADGEAPEWMLPAARELYACAVADGWDVDGAPGFVYTTDFDGQPIVHERMHWVACEGVSASAALRGVLLAEAGSDAAGAEAVAGAAAGYEADYRTWLDYASAHLIKEPGVWWHELDAANEVSTRTWAGHPDVYHALQATLLSRVPVWPSLPRALAEGLLDVAQRA